MSMKWEVDLRIACEDDDSDDVFLPDEDEEFFDLLSCPREACLGDCLSLLP